jgi:phosphatidylserine/phosphatidylglycerophosphate/cardiolipin synthase-like enzyme
LELVAADLPDVFVPDLRPFPPTLERVAAARYFEPLKIKNRTLKVLPLLTPDNYIEEVTSLIEGAEKCILVQNQSLGLKDCDNEEAFVNLLNVLKDQQRHGRDVRIIFRDKREHYNDNTAVVSNLRGLGFDASRIRVQWGCHTKGILIDSKIAILGSHNWTNSGVLVNRDASVVVHDDEVAKYFEEIFEFDWKYLSTQDAEERRGTVRFARGEEATPPGMRRVALTDLLADD